MPKLDPPKPTTAIPELLSRPLTSLEYETAVDAISAVSRIQEAKLNPVGGATVVWRLELAAAFLADVFHQLDDAAEMNNRDAGDTHKLFADICVRRAREIYGQGGA